MVGEVAFLTSLRGSRAARAAGSIRRYCGSCQLLWRVGDRRNQTRLASLQAAIASQTADQRRFQSHGAPIPQRSQDEWMREHVALWQRASLQMDAIARRMGSIYLHALQPNQYLPGSKPLSADERRLAYTEEIRHRPLIEAGYPMLIEAGARLSGQGVRFTDLTSLFVSEPATPLR